jgi:hypothetical protein
MLRQKLGWAVLLVVAACDRAAGATPADAALPEGRETAIECEYNWFEEQLLFNSGMVPASVVVSCFKLRFGRLADATGIRRYERLAWLDRLAGRHRLDSQPEIRETVKQVRDDLSEALH